MIKLTVKHKEKMLPWMKAKVEAEVSAFKRTLLTEENAELYGVSVDPMRKPEITCSICFENFTDDESITVFLPCKCVLHSNKDCERRVKEEFNRGKKLHCVICRSVNPLWRLRLAKFVPEPLEVIVPPVPIQLRTPIVMK